jgi:hypothetical protein
MERAANVSELYAYDRIVPYGDNGMPEYETRLTALPDKPAASIMVVAVTGEIIPNHNDIFTSPFVDFVSRVINAGLYGRE